MLKIYKYAIALLICICAIGFTNAQSLIYYNNFTSGQSVWTNVDDAQSNANVTGGKYVLMHKQHTASITLIPATIDYTKDFAIETTVNYVTGAAYPIGLAFGAASVLDMYYFGISHTGQFIVAAFEKSANKIIVNWTPSTAILQGSLPNKLRVEKTENEFKYYINDIQVYVGPVLQPYGNSIGVMVCDQQTAAFDYLKAVYIAPATNVTTIMKPVSADITEMAYHTDFNSDDQNSWVLPPITGVSTSLSNGYFTISRALKTAGITSSTTAVETKVNMNRDYVIETAAVHYSGTSNFGYGLEFACDTARQYNFWITPLGYYSIGYTHGSTYNTMTAWTLSPAIVKTAMRLNKLSIVHKNGQLSFYINDQQVTSYPELNFTGHQFGVSIAADQSVGFDYLTIGYLDKAPVIVQNNTTADLTPPDITITAPQVTRGLKVVQSSDVLHVAGIAKDASGIFSVVVNGIQATVDQSGNFTADIPMAIGDNPLMVVATDMNMNKGTYRFNIVRNNITVAAQTDVTQSASQGKYYAVLIGEQNYQDQTIQSLEGPVGDATLLSQTLGDKYTFAPENVTLLKNPTREQFFKTFEDLTEKVTDADNVVIFYAGHGYYDDNMHEGYWFPSDAVRTRKDTWISNADVISYIIGLKAKHTLLISDACFSGSIFKTRSIEMAPKDIQELYKMPSRKAMTSGNMKEVPDNSVFMKYLVERLNQNTDKFLPAEQLFASFRAAVTNNSPNQQVPEFGEIRQSGDEGGDFIFIKKN